MTLLLQSANRNMMVSKEVLLQSDYPPITVPLSKGLRRLFQKGIERMNTKEAYCGRDVAQVIDLRVDVAGLNLLLAHIVRQALGSRNEHFICHSLGFDHDRAKADTREDEDVVGLPRHQLLALIFYWVKWRSCITTDMFFTSCQFLHVVTPLLHVVAPLLHVFMPLLHVANADECGEHCC